ncbi:tetratricopeptide repeat protein 4, partial [Tremellales sp. Uapishka_1]
MVQDDLDRVIDAMAPAGPSAKKPTTMKEFEKVLNSTPLFMRETPTDGEENEVMSALQSLMFEGEGDEVALNFKNHGNELYAQKSYKDAITAYTQGLDAAPKDEALRISLLSNRAACNLPLKNFGAVLKDTGVVIALAAAKGDAPPVKAMYRAAQSLVALEKWTEARDCIERGGALKGEEGNAVWKGLLDRVDMGESTVEERKERARREKVGKEALRRAVEARGVVIVNTNAPPDNPHPLSFDLSTIPPAPPLFSRTPTEKWYPPPLHHPLIFPVFLLYPQHNTSDLITHFHENTSFDDQLAVIFPASASSSDGNPPWSDWDKRREYYTDNLSVYVETAQRRLLKVGKGITLREVLEKGQLGKAGQKDGVVLRDGLMSFVVLVKGKEEKEWIEHFKKMRDEGKT